jgi:hypothetical protein
MQYETDAHVQSEKKGSPCPIGRREYLQHEESIYQARMYLRVIAYW